MLDFAGPLQTFHEANSLGGEYRIEHCASDPRATTNQGLQLSGLAPLPTIADTDLAIVPGFTLGQVHLPRTLIAWLKKSYDQGASISSVCTGAFALATPGS